MLAVGKDEDCLSKIDIKLLMTSKIGVIGIKTSQIALENVC